MNKKMIAILIGTLLLSGCWGLMELPDVAIVSGVGIDLVDSGEYEVTTQSIQPIAIEEKQPTGFITRSSRGVTIFEAVRNFIYEMGKKQLWEHVDALIISSDIAQNNILAATDFLYRDHEPRPKMICFISKGQARELLELESELHPVPAIAIREAMENQADLSKAPYVELKDFKKLIAEPFQDPYLPIIQKNQEDFDILGTALFKEEKMIGELSPIETRSMLRILGEVEGGLQVLNLNQGSNDNEPQYATVEIKNSQSKIEAVFDMPEPKIKITIKEKAVIGDINPPFPINEDTLKTIETIYAQTVKNELVHAVNKIQKEYKVNVLKFAEVIRRSNREYWKINREEWDEIYPTLPIVIEVQTDIAHSQLIKDRIGTKNKE
ncbi:Ger(x)C family spore germination protein [Alkalihalobacterium elongatum]|uniref:Ger(x)C family spore germination protein n=1 Tax=Alkalihalobacterium elongatum TaxID=2675466 RepID=UPI001C1FB2EA|nr:Ger(x)C family spore germination protein [Alkalihalobacterium elongatum]